MPNGINSFENVSNIDLAYTAGLIDGEGCVFIAKAKRKANPYYYLLVQVQMIDFIVINWLKDTFQGSSRFFKNAKYKDGIIYNWAVYNRQAMQFLEKIEPYTKLKSPHIRVARKLNKTIGHSGKKLTEAVLIEREKLYYSMKQLNAKRE